MPLASAEMRSKVLSRCSAPWPTAARISRQSA